MSPQINIVLLTDCLEDFTGGAEKQILELAKRLDRSRFLVSVVSLDCEGSVQQKAVESLGCDCLSFRVKRIYGMSGLIEGINFFRYLKQQDVKILLTYHFSSDIWGSFWAKLAGVPVIISNRRDMGFWRKGWHVWCYRLFNPLVSKIVTVCQAVKNTVMETEGVPEDKINVIYNGVELEERSKEAKMQRGKEFGIKDNEIVLMHVANFKPVKGHEYLLKALAQVDKEHQNWKLVLIGEDEMDGFLERLAAELNLKEKILFLGKRRDVRQLLTLADICVLPSLSEGMSNAILEYMAAGKPVIATAVGGNPELVTESETGLLVPPQDIQSLKMALISLKNNPQMREKMGAGGAKRVKDVFGMDSMVKNYQNLFESLLPVK